MKNYCTAALAMLAGFALGAIAIGGLNAQGKPPGAYGVVDVSEISDSAAFNQNAPKASATVAAIGGRFIARTENIVAVAGTPPKRFVIIAFDSIDRAKAWNTDPANREIGAILDKYSKQRRFIVEGM